MSNKKGTRVICISDTHRRQEGFSERFKLPEMEGDILVHTGDIDLHYEKFGKWFTGLPHKYKIVIPGNHDYIEHVLKLHDPSKNVIVLCDTTAIVQGVKFYGHPWCRCEDSSQLGIKPYGKIPIGCDVLLTHVPPKNILDLAWDPKRSKSGDFCKHCQKTHDRFVHWGYRSLLKEVKEMKPHYHVFGHVHDDPGVYEEEGTKFINATSWCVDYQAPIIFDFDRLVGKERDFEPLRCSDRFLSMDGVMTKDCEVKWRLTKEGYLENDKSTFLSAIKNEESYVVRTTKEKITKWKFFADTLISDVGLVLDNDKYNQDTAILWKSRGSPNQKWRFD